MSRIFVIFTIGLGGVFISMALLYGAIRFNALVTDLITEDRGGAGKKGGADKEKNAGKEREE